jgi:plasmid stabilization system protein ParE
VKVSFLSLAQKELDDAVAWHNEQVSALGIEFLDELDRAVRPAATFPLSCPEIEPGIRRCLVNRFPYGVVYGVDGENIV